MNKEQVHIRIQPTHYVLSTKTLCGLDSTTVSSVSFKHARENPSAHLNQLESEFGICDRCCVNFVDAIAKEKR